MIWLSEDWSGWRGSSFVKKERWEWVQIVPSSSPSMNVQTSFAGIQNSVSSQFHPRLAVVSSPSKAAKMHGSCWLLLLLPGFGAQWHFVSKGKVGKKTFGGTESSQNKERIRSTRPVNITWFTPVHGKVSEWLWDSLLFGISSLLVVVPSTCTLRFCPKLERVVRLSWLSPLVLFYFYGSSFSCGVSSLTNSSR